MQSKHQVTVALCGLRRWIAELGLDEEEVAAAVVAAPRMLAMPLREAQENLSALAAALKLGVAEQGDVVKAAPTCLLQDVVAGHTDECRMAYAKVRRLVQQRRRQQSETATHAVAAAAQPDGGSNVPAEFQESGDSAGPEMARDSTSGDAVPADGLADAAHAGSSGS